jgi:FMN-dependent NADH-azoreductase
MASPKTSKEPTMNTILHLTSSIFGEKGESSRLSSEFVDRLPDTKVIRRDLGKDPIPHLDGARFGAFLSRPDTRTPEQQAVLDQSNALIAELQAADTIVIGAPLYNFGISSQLKAWFDHVARAGVTFKYTDTGSVGLLSGRKAYVFTARGGHYAGTPADIHTAYLKTMLGFLGIADVTFVHAEGLAISKDRKAAALAAARNALRALVQPETIAA